MKVKVTIEYEYEAQPEAYQMKGEWTANEFAEAIFEIDGDGADEALIENACTYPSRIWMEINGYKREVS